MDWKRDRRIWFRKPVRVLVKDIQVVQIQKRSQLKKKKKKKRSPDDFLPKKLSHERGDRSNSGLNDLNSGAPWMVATVVTEKS